MLQSLIKVFVSYKQRSIALPLTVCWRSRSTTGWSVISNQLEAGLIMVRAIKSICKLSLPLRLYGPMRSTQKHSQGFVMTVFGGRCPYLWDRLLLIWQHLQDFVSDRMVVRIPFRTSQYSSSLWDVCVQGAVGSGNTIWLHTPGAAWG